MQEMENLSNRPSRSENVSRDTACSLVRYLDSRSWQSALWKATEPDTRNMNDFEFRALQPVHLYEGFGGTQLLRIPKTQETAMLAPRNSGQE
jgi:hypothetical protein